MCDDCIHRGSKRDVGCCGMPSLFVCKLFKDTCIESIYDRSKLIAMVDTDESKETRVCETCDSYAKRQ